MRSLALVATLCGTSAFETSPAAWADTASSPPAASPEAPVPATAQELQERLKSFSPVAVAAARHLYESRAMKAAILEHAAHAMAAIKEAEILKGQSNEARDTIVIEYPIIRQGVWRLAAEHYNDLIGPLILDALQLFSKDELVALDNFNSSSLHEDVLAKMMFQNARDVIQAAAPKLLDAEKARRVDKP